MHRTLIEFEDWKSHLQTLLASRLKWQRTHRHKRSKNDTTSRVDRSLRVVRGRENGDDGSQKTTDTVQHARDARACASVGRGEDFRGVGVEDTVPLITSVSTLHADDGGEGKITHMMFWKKETKLEKASWKSLFWLTVKRKRKIPVMSVEMAMVPFRPMYLRFTV